MKGIFRVVPAGLRLLAGSAGPSVFRKPVFRKPVLRKLALRKLALRKLARRDRDPDDAGSLRRWGLPAGLGQVIEEKDPGIRPPVDARRGPRGQIRLDLEAHHGVRVNDSGKCHDAESELIPRFAPWLGSGFVRGGGFDHLRMPRRKARRNRPRHQSEETPESGLRVGWLARSRHRDTLLFPHQPRRAASCPSCILLTHRLAGHRRRRGVRPSARLPITEPCCRPST